MFATKTNTKENYSNKTSQTFLMCIHFENPYETLYLRLQLNCPTGYLNINILGHVKAKPLCQTKMNLRDNWH